VRAQHEVSFLPHHSRENDGWGQKSGIYVFSFCFYSSLMIWACLYYLLNYLPPPNPRYCSLLVFIVYYSPHHISSSLVFLPGSHSSLCGAGSTHGAFFVSLFGCLLGCRQCYNWSFYACPFVLFVVSFSVIEYALGYFTTPFFFFSCVVFEPSLPPFSLRYVSLPFFWVSPWRLSVFSFLFSLSCFFFFLLGHAVQKNCSFCVYNFFSLPPWLVVAILFFFLNFFFLFFHACF
jgi:hypothetical protein